MTSYLLDTNILSAFIRAPAGALKDKVATTTTICTSILVAAELRFGVVKRASPNLTAQVEILLAGLTVHPFAPPADQHYAKIRTFLERTGNAIGNNDLLIAAHALALGCVLVTDNVREFSRVPGLTVENWLR